MNYFFLIGRMILNPKPLFCYVSGALPIVACLMGPFLPSERETMPFLIGSHIYLTIKRNGEVMASLEVVIRIIESRKFPFFLGNFLYMG